MFLAFHDIDSDNSGVIRLDELLTYFHITKTALTERIFFDKVSSNSHFLNFEQFVVYTWQFLSLALDKVATFAFHLLDTKNTGTLTQERVQYLIELMHNKTIEESKDVQFLVKKCTVLHGDTLTISDFEKFSSCHRKLCDPFRKLQIAYQSKLLGRVIWKRLRVEREEKAEGYLVTDDVADVILAKYRQERRLYTSLIELEERESAVGARIAEMMNEPVIDEPATNREMQQVQAEDTADRIVLPMESKIRVPKSCSLRKTPKLIPRTEPHTAKKKKKRKNRRRSMDKDNFRRHSLDTVSCPPMLKDISNVEIFKSKSLDLCDDENTNSVERKNSSNAGDDIKKTKGVKHGAIVPF